MSIGLITSETSIASLNKVGREARLLDHRVTTSPVQMRLMWKVSDNARQIIEPDPLNLLHCLNHAASNAATGTPDGLRHMIITVFMDDKRRTVVI